MRLILGLMALVAILSCTGRSASTSEPSSPVVEPEGVRERALLLLMADRRYYDTFTIGSVRQENPELGALLATSLGRIGDERALPALHSLLLHPKPEVRRQAALALGLMGDDESKNHLLGAVSDPDSETAVWAVAALADLGVGLERVRSGMSSLPEKDRWQRLSAFLHRFPPLESVAGATLGLEQLEPDTRALVVYALARNPTPETLEALRSSVEDPDPWVRGWAARALGRVGDRSDLARLRRLLDDSAEGPTIQALRAARQLIRAGKAAPPADWRDRLLQLMEDGRVGARLSAIEAAGAWLRDESLAAVLRQRAEVGPRRDQEIALLSLADGGDRWAVDRATRLVTAGEAWKRRLAADVASVIDDRELLQYLRYDKSPKVRIAALVPLLNLDDGGSQRIAAASLEDEDPGVRAAVLEWLVDNPVAPADLISRAILGPGNRLVIGLRLFGIRALLSRAIAEPLERGLVVENLESLARVGEYPARREAASALAALDRPIPSIGAAGSQKSTETYMQIILQTDEDHVVRIETRHGSIDLELQCAEARMTCLNFLQLARQGFFDEQTFHRVVPDFIVQTGDPRGDGWGGPGYTLRDEINRTRFERGVVGMAASGPDTAGSQFFIALSRQPHLDGRYTAFARVVAGDEVLDRLAQGDRLDRARVVR